MKVRVTQALEIRRDASHLGESWGVLQPGYIFDIDEIVQGLPYKDSANKNWCRDKYGFYYWSGGLVEVNGNGVAIPGTLKATPIATGKSVELPWYIKEFGIDEIWKKTKGEGVKIAILDCGVNERHPALSNAFLRGRNHISATQGPTTLVNDEDGHGTMCASIAAGSGVNSVFGVAPMSSLLVQKIFRVIGDPIPKPRVIRAIKDAVAAGADIISMSFSLGDANSDELRQCIEEAAKQNVIFLASSSNEGIVGSQILAIPAKWEHVIAVGAMNESNRRLSNSNLDTSKDMFHCPATNVSIALNTGLGSTTIPSGDTSIAAPYMAGLIALILANRKKGSISPQQLIQHLKDTSINIGSIEQPILKVNPIGFYKSFN